MDGHCLCGSVAITLKGPKPALEICQCDMCRRWGGAFYAAQSADEARVSGDGAITVYRSSAWVERAFCAHCGSNLWFRFLPTGRRSFSAGLFDGARRAVIEREIFVDEAAHWCRLDGGYPRLSGAEIIAEAKAAGFFPDRT